MVDSKENYKFDLRVEGLRWLLLRLMIRSHYQIPMGSTHLLYYAEYLLADIGLLQNTSLSQWNSILGHHTETNIFFKRKGQSFKVLILR